MKKYFFTGLATLLPLAVTIYIAHIIIHFLTKPFMNLTMSLLNTLQIHSVGIFSQEQVIRVLSQTLILIGLFLFILLIGLIGRWFLFTLLIKSGDQILHRIPLINKVYKTSKEIIQTLFVSNKNSFKQVVLITFPNQNCYCLGLVSKESPTTCKEVSHESELVSVFIPTTPNPTSGYMVMRKKSDLILLDMKSEEAIKYVVSCGVIQPGARELI